MIHALTGKTMIETERLILRRFCKEDLQDLYEYVSDETVVRFEPYKPMAMNDVKEDYAAESCTALVRKAFSEGVHRIYAKCDPRNTAS